MKSKVLGLVLAGACVCSSVQASTWYVNAAATGANTGTSQEDAFTALSEAISAASAHDTILIVGADQAQTGTINKDVTVLGPGPDKMTLTASAGKLSVSSAGAVLSGFKLAANSTTTTSALYLYNGTVTNCVFDNCVLRATYGRTSLYISGGRLVDCKITRGHNGNWNDGVCSSSADTQTYCATTLVGGPCTIENCLFADNYRGFGNYPSYVYRASDRMKGPGAAMDVYSTAGTVVITNCTFAGNKGQRTGAFDALKGTVKVYNSVFAENMGYSDVTNLSVYASDDMYLGAGTVKFENCLISQTPRAPKNTTYVNCRNNRAAGFTDPQNSDYSLTLGSPAYGWGYHAGTAPTAFACAVETPTAIRANGSITVTLAAKLFNQPEGAATYEWDLDGDGTYETTDQGATFDHTFTAVGWNKVGLRVTIGDQSVTYAADNFVYVAPSVIYMNANGSSTFPYDTAEKGAKSFPTALTAAIDGSYIQVGAGTYSGQGTFYKEVTVAADPDAATVPVLYGTAGNAYGFVMFDHVTMRGFSISGGHPTVSIVGESAVSNCTVTGAGYAKTLESGKGVCMGGGILSHCTIKDCRVNNGDGIGIYLGRGTVRNCLVVNCGPNTGTSNNNAPVHVVSGTIENCTIANCGTTLSSATAAVSGGIYLAGKATLKNNAIWGNNLGAATADIQKSIVAASSSVLASSTIDYNCIQYTTDDAAIGEHCYHADPVFANPNNGDYSISTTSGLYNKGTDLDWTDAGADLAGNARKQGAAVDLGAYEADAAVIELDFSMATLSGGVGEAEVELAVAGDTSSFKPEDILWDLDGDGEYDDATGFVITNVFGEGMATVGMKYSDKLDPKVHVDCLDVKALTVYVAPSASATDPQYPYNTREHATSSFDAAQEACGDGSTILVGEGKYNGCVFGSVLKAITIRGEAGAAKTVLSGGDGGGLSSGTCTTIANAGAVLEGVTVSGYWANAMRMTAGTIRNCIFENDNHTTGSGVGLVATAGLVEKTTFRNCNDSSVATGGHGVAVVLGDCANPGVAYSATMRNCVVYGISGGGKAGVSAVYVGKGCLMESCTIAHNAMLEPAVENYGQVLNCVMYGNTSANDTSSAGTPDWSVHNTGTFTHSLGEKQPEGEGNVGGDPDFTDLAKNDFTFTAASPLFNAGANQAWMAEATDFAGNVRISGGTVDIGAYEADADAEDVNISVSANTGVGSLEVTMTAVASGFTMSDQATFAWTVSNRLTSATSTYDENPSTGAFGVGTFDVYVTVTNADGAGASFNRHKKNAFVVYPTELYVTAATEGVNPVYPYNTAETAATNFADVIAIAYDGATIHLDAGIHYVSKLLSSVTAVTIVGQGTDKTFLSNPQGVACGVLSIANAGASVSDLTICGAAQPMLTIGAGGGLVEDVVFSNLVESTSSTEGGALRILGGTVKRCRIEGNACDRSQVAIYVSGESAILEDCLVTGNSSVSTKASAAGAIYLAQGQVRNCTVVKNSSTAGAGGVRIVPTNPTSVKPVDISHVTGSIVWGNTCGAGTGLSNFAVDSTYAYRVQYTYLYPLLTGSSQCIYSEEDPGFTDYAAGDYTLVGRDAAVYNKGLYGSWMDDALDLSGKSRLKHAPFHQVDMGCYEAPFEASGLKFLLK